MPKVSTDRCMSSATPMSEIPGVVARCRATFRKGALRTIDQRKAALRQLKLLLEEHEVALCDALKADLGKSHYEAMATEVLLVKTDVIHALDHLSSWAKPTPADREGIQLLDPARIHHDPFGACLIIGAWNYPVQLVLLPLVGALSGGNTVVVKPSEVSPHTAALLAKLLPTYFSNGIVQVVLGAVAETSALLEAKWDHIFYTGSGAVGRIVATAAAKHLTPVTLELGGKSPCIVDETANVDVAARRIMWGRFMNAGQTCIAPDYLLVHPAVKAQLIQSLRTARDEFMGPDPKACTDYARIVNERHFERVRKLLAFGTIVVGGEIDAATNFIAPTVLDKVAVDSPLMTEEIFGPLLPIVEFRTADEAINFVNDRDKPLALYVFSTRKDFIKRVLDETTAGGVTINDTLMHTSVAGLPFGGVGPSGCGCYHGKHSFDNYTHRKAVLVKNPGLERVNRVRYPPYSPWKLSVLKAVMAKSKERGPVSLSTIVAIGALAFAGRYAWNWWSAQHGAL